MNVAGPSRRVVPPGRHVPRTRRSQRVEGSYKQDLLVPINQLSFDEVDEMKTFFARRVGGGERLSDHDTAMNELPQQVQALAVLNEDWVVVQDVATDLDEGWMLAVGTEPTGRPIVQMLRRVAVPHRNRRGTGAQQNRSHTPVRAINGAAPSQRWRRWSCSVMGRVFGSQPASEPGPTNTTPPRRPAINRPTGHDCVICQDPIHGAEIRAPCGHYYDTTCITDLFRSATRDETLYPPRCCRQNIPFAQVRPHLSQALITTFREKEREFSTLKRVYCSSPTCSRFLGPVLEGIFGSKVYTCPTRDCRRRTCGKCRERYLGKRAHVCRPDADAQVLELGHAAGWARCPGCSQMIELNAGCSHMMCRCRTEFCYLCHARWKTCKCPQWDEYQLLAAAEERVNARLGGGRERGARRLQRGHLVRAPPMRLEHPPAAPRPPIPAWRPTPAPPAPPARPVTPVRPVAPQRSMTQALAQPPQSAYMDTMAFSSIRQPRHTALTPIVLTFASASASIRPASTPAPASVSSGQPRGPKTDDTAQQRLVCKMMERLRVDHECSHTKWRYRSRGGTCQSCGHHLPLYLFRCEDCEMSACSRCRRNRL